MVLYHLFKQELLEVTDLVGMMIGAILFGILADKFGRKKVLIASIVLFSIFGLLCGFASRTNKFLNFSIPLRIRNWGHFAEYDCLIDRLHTKTMKNTMVQISMIFLSYGRYVSGLFSYFPYTCFWLAKCLLRIAVAPTFVPSGYGKEYP